MPLTIVIVYYIRNFKKIKTLEFFKAKKDVYGSASWANQEEIERANLWSKHGMLLGQNSVGYFVADGFQHSLLFAPTSAVKAWGS